MTPRAFAYSLMLLTPLLHGAVDYNREVRPILSDRCFACHGPDSATREAGLRLDTFEGATAKLESGKQAIIPGNPKASELFTRIHEKDPDEIMPPPKLNRPLTADERDVLIRWIKEGAVYAEHWAFIAAKKHPLPVVKNASWPRNDIDRFILEKLEQQKLQPNPQADKAALLRRISFVLTGLPPTPEQVTAFVNDTSPNAYEKQVDGLLASPRFGERMALDWLDVARFADTYGYQSDKECFVWPWRNWVIDAFNKNLSYDKFLAWQIAGDLLPNATQDQRLATTFNRLHRQTEEGGSIEEEFRQEYVSDRVHTAGTAFLGLTLECSKCHDHKYDPLPQADYYSMSAMFGQIDESGLKPYSISTSAPEPSMRIMEPSHIPEFEKRQVVLTNAQAALQKTLTSRDAAFEQWLTTTPSLSQPTPSDHFPLNSGDEKITTNSIPSAEPASVSGGELSPVEGAIKGAVQFDGDTVLLLNGVKGITRHQPLTISLRLFTPDKKQRAAIIHTGPALFSQMADAAGFEMLMEKGKLRWSCIHLWPGCAVSIETTDDFPIAKWVHVTVTYDGFSSAQGLKMYFDGKPIATKVLHDHLDKNITAQIMRIGARPRDDRGFADGRIDEIKIFRQPLSPVEVADLHAPLLEASFQAAKTGDPIAKAAMRTHYLERVDLEIATAREAVTAARKSLQDDFEAKLPLIMVMKESPNPKQFHVLTRGDYASPDLKRPVEAAPPKAVFPFDPKAPKNRLGLAQWMTDPKNPLVSRVAVNRLWMMCFGNGIVATQENFGLQGDAPSHMELLDTLAYDFSHNGWDTKQMIKRMLMSATFQQSSASSLKKQEIDPKNQLLARGPSYRLSAEAIRDQALLASGLLVERLGGPSVKPWQPDGVWSESGASGGEYKPDTGEGRYRRSLYTYRKRTAPPPGLLTLDAGSREICQPRRLATNTPLQPLLFLNDQGFFECAKSLAKRVIKEQASGPDPQIQHAFLWLTSRQPATEEMTILRDLYAQQLAHFTAEMAAAKSICGEENPALAAMTLVCSTLITSDAALTNR